MLTGIVEEIGTISARKKNGMHVLSYRNSYLQESMPDTAERGKVIWRYFILQ